MTIISVSTIIIIITYYYIYREAIYCIFNMCMCMCMCFMCKCPQLLFLIFFLQNNVYRIAVVVSTSSVIRFGFILLP